MTQRILIMGLPGSGKTYLAQNLLGHLQTANKRVAWLNADDVRKKYNDWDFSKEGRIRQSLRMRELADAMTDIDYVICDFVAPTNTIREQFNANFLIFVDTQNVSAYQDTNDIFEKPQNYNVRVESKHAVYWANQISKQLKLLD